MLVNFGDISLQAISRGTGELVVLLPFLGRSVRDFDALSAQLLEAGFRVLAINPRGVGESSGPRKEMTLEDHVSDVIRVIEAAGGGQAHVVGYGFGGHVARRLLESHPERVLSIVLIGAGGTTRTKTPVLMQQIRRAAFRRFGLMASNMRNTALPLQKQQGNALRGILKRAYFGADATVPAAWFDGWYPEAGLAQHVLLETSGPGGWWQRSTAPILVIQGAEDRLTDPRNGLQLREQLGERVQLVEVTGAGHAVLTEQPEQTGAAIRSFLQMHRTVAMGADARGAATSAEQAGSSSDRGSTMGRMSGSFQYQPVETVGGLQVIKVTNDSMRRFSKEPGHYDVAIVGTGLTGSVLANRLSEDPGTTVLVLEAGRSDWRIDPFIHMPAALAFPIGSRFYDWKYESEPEPHMSGRKVYHARGKVLGGSSSINGMIFQRGNPLDYERWAGDAGMRTWDYAHCLPYFKRMENCLAGADELVTLDALPAVIREAIEEGALVITRH